MKKELPVTPPDLLRMKREKRRIVSLTCYDFPTSRLLKDCDVDVLLVGDSLGMVRLGYANTLRVTMEEMILHTRSVVRARPRALLVADMPYLSCHVSPQETIRNAGRLLRSGGAAAVKVEGGREMLPMIQALQRAKIPVMGHLGLLPQSIGELGGYRVQGRLRRDAKRILEDAKRLERAGVFAIVLECVPAGLAKQISRAVRVPTIGIGAGPGCDGQILVVDDLLGITPDPAPRFVKRYARLSRIMSAAFRQYAADVREGAFPGKAQSYS